MKVNNIMVKNILDLRHKADKYYDFNLSFSHKEAFECLKFLYPLSSTRRDTGEVRKNEYHYGETKIIIHTEIRELSRYRNVQTAELNFSDWLTYYCDPANIDWVKRVAKFIPDMRKQMDFVKIHETLGKLKVRKMLGSHIITKVELENPYPFYYYSGDDSSCFSNTNDVNDEIQFISYNGQRISILTKGGKTLHLDITKDDMLMINLIEDLNDEFHFVLDKWKEDCDKAIEHDKDIILEARKITAKYEIVSKL
jgi:hypothetical protein